MMGTMRFQRMAIQKDAGFSLLTVSRILAVGCAAPSAAATVGARGVEGVVAVVRQVALLSVTTGAPGPAWRSAVPDSDLTELLVDLEALQTQLLHLLQETERQVEVRRELWCVINKHNDPLTIGVVAVKPLSIFFKQLQDHDPFQGFSRLVSLFKASWLWIVVYRKTFWRQWDFFSFCSTSRDHWETSVRHHLANLILSFFFVFLTHQCVLCTLK